MKIRARQGHSSPRGIPTHKQLRPVQLRLHLAMSLLVASNLSCGVFSAHAADASPTIKVRVINYTAAASFTTVTRAEREAARILEDAGLNVVWLDCPVGQSAAKPTDPCREPLLPTDILLRVLTDKNRKGVQGEAFGFAVVPVLASVYYEHAVSLARYGDYETPKILGCVMVHEIGHLLLGLNSHSDFGIMRAHWRRKEIQKIMWGGLHFTPQQSEMIRAEGQTRMQAARAQQSPNGAAPRSPSFSLESGFLIPARRASD